ncbi:hypothetical protein OIU74_027321 [Salix koriyanagi]|uniref:Uncharacterized protein n=1 Tax=Salix koriyanagi TaxID=2511006 RepID=A0A9Q0W2R9_9ROSI|nr:hypothetical protein OIU74_027321 [Salix koriyanagi]
MMHGDCRSRIQEHGCLIVSQQDKQPVEKDVDIPCSVPSHPITVRGQPNNSDHFSDVPTEVVASHNANGLPLSSDEYSIGAPPSLAGIQGDGDDQRKPACIDDGASLSPLLSLLCY